MSVFFYTNISVNYNLIIKSFLIASLFTIGTVNATEITTLKESVAYAVSHNRLLAADGSMIEGSRANQDLAKSQFMPRLGLSTGVMRADSPGTYFVTKLNQQKISAADFNPAAINNPGYINNYQTRLQVNMSIYQGGALWAGKRQSDHQAEAALLGHDYMQQQVIYQTVFAYARTRQTKAAIHAMQTAVGAAEKRYQDTQAMQKRGVLIASDVMDAQVHLLRSQLKLKQARHAFSQAIEQLQRIMGLARETVLNIEGDPDLVVTERTLSQSMQQALLMRPDLKALEAAYQASQAGVDLSKSGFLPHVDLVAGQEWNASTPALKNRNSMIGATVTMNLFAGGADKARMRASHAKQAELEWKIADHKQQIQNEVANAWRMLDESKVRDASEREALKQSEESLRIKSLRHTQGLAKTSDLLDAQLQVDTTRLSSIQAKYDTTIAQAALHLAVGTLNEEVIR